MLVEGICRYDGNCESRTQKLELDVLNRLDQTFSHLTAILSPGAHWENYLDNADKSKFILKNDSICISQVYQNKHNTLQDIRQGILDMKMKKTGSWRSLIRDTPGEINICNLV